MLQLLSYLESDQKGLQKFTEKCGSRDNVFFFTHNDSEYFMMSENYSLEYIGFTIIKDDEITHEFFFQSENDIQSLIVVHGFDWNMLPHEKAEILLQFCME